VSPGLDEVMLTLGKDRVIGRLKRVVDLMRGQKVS